MQVLYTEDLIDKSLVDEPVFNKNTWKTILLVLGILVIVVGISFMVFYIKKIHKEKLNSFKK